MGMYHTEVYFNCNPSPVDVLHRLQLRFNRQLIVDYINSSLVDISNPTDKKDKISCWWTERDLVLPPELTGVVEIPYPDLQNVIVIEAIPVKQSLFTAGSGYLHTSIVEILEQLGGKLKPTAEARLWCELLIQ